MRRNSTAALRRRSSAVSSVFRAVPSLVAAAALLSGSLLAAGNATAASLEGPLSGWQLGSEPSTMSMYIYVPDNVAPNPPILVVLHYCSGNAGAVFSQARDGGMVSLADQNGFILLIPQTANNCWDVGTPASLTNGGGGDTGAIVRQVEYTVSEYGANPDRVYAVGTSGGGMAVQGLLAVYPDVFKGGAEFSGVPAGCWAVGNETDGQWSGACADGNVTHTAEEWGDIVRDMYPGYDGFRPRVQLWHGTNDSTISFVNHTEAIKQWRNVLGLPETPTTTTDVTVGGVTFTRDEWKDDCDITLLDVFTEPNGPHNTSANMSGEYSMPFLSLDVVGDTDPQVASGCSTSTDDPMTDDAATDDAATDDAATDDAATDDGSAEDPIDDTPADDGVADDSATDDGSGDPTGAGGMSGTGETPTTGGMGGGAGTPDTSGTPTVGGMGGGAGSTPAPTSGNGGGGVPAGGASTTTPGSTTPGNDGTGVPPATAGTNSTGAPAAGAPSAAGTDTMTGGGSSSDDSGCALNPSSSSNDGIMLALAGLFAAMVSRRRMQRRAR